MIRNRIGLYMMKAGCTHVFRGESVVPVTLLSMKPLHIIGLKSQERDGYNAVVLGYGNFKSVSKPQSAMLLSMGISEKHKFYETRVHSTEGYKVGDKIDLSHFLSGQYIDVTGTTIGKGFAGVMKRHNFSGMCASHGVSLSHRVMGSAGQCQDPGKVNKGKKMPGRMGCARRMVSNLRVMEVDLKLQVLVVKGNSIPGNRGDWVFIADAVRKVLPANAPVPYRCVDVAEGQNEV